MHSHHAAFKYLLEQGADITLRNGEILLETLSSTEYHWPYQYWSYVKLLLQYDIDINVQNGQALLLAIENEYLYAKEWAKQLLDEGIKSSYEEALSYACFSIFPSDQFKALVKAGLDVMLQYDEALALANSYGLYYIARYIENLANQTPENKT